MAVAYNEIARILDGARRRQARIVVGAAAGFGLAAAFGVVLVGAVLLATGTLRPALVRPLVLTAALLELAAAVAWGVRELLRGAWSQEAAARTVARDAPALRSDLVSSVELERAREEITRRGDYSVALVDAHIDRTAAAVRGIDLRSVLPDRLARRGAFALLAVAALHLVAVAAFGGKFLRGYGRVLAGDPAGALAPALDPITGDIELSYAYPAYMRREPAVITGTGGEVRAPKGTDVRLKTRADRAVKAAEIVIAFTAVPPSVPPSPQPSPPASESSSTAPATRTYALAVTNDRDLEGRLSVVEGGSYRFRFLDAKGRVIAEGPPIPIVLEPDLFPEVKILSPPSELEVEAQAPVKVEWQASDDFGLGTLALVTKTPSGPEKRRPLRTFDSSRRDGGSFLLDLAPEKLSEGEKLLYWVEVTDNDTVSGPKRAASATQTVKIYSEAEHRRAILDEAKRHWEELVRVLADRLELFAAGRAESPERLPLAETLDARVREVHEKLRETAARLRKEKAAPPEIGTALANVAASVRLAEQRATSARQTLSRSLRLRIPPDQGLRRHIDRMDAQLDGALEKGILYLESLLDKRRAEDLVHLAKDLAAKRRDLAGLLEKYKDAPSEEAKKEVLAQIARMKERMQEMMARMSELAKGFNDEHMNQEALQELAKSGNVMSGLEKVEDLLAKGDVEGAMKELDQLGNEMEKMLSGLQQTAGMPDEKAQELMKEMLAFKKSLEDVQAEQQRVAKQTDALKGEYRKKMAERMKDAAEKAKRLEQLAKEAREELAKSEPGVSLRAEGDFAHSEEGLKNLERALGMRDFDAALDSVKNAMPAMQRLAMSLEEDAAMAERYQELTGKDPGRIREAEQHAMNALPKAAQVREELEKLFPDPRQVMSQKEQQRLGELSKEQSRLEQKAGELQQQLGQLMEQAPIFPPSASGQLGESRGHMGQAAMELGQRNPQRGHGEQELAMDALERFQKGLEQMAKQGGGGPGGQGFPFPFAEQGGGQSGDGHEPSQEKVEIPGAEAHKVPEEFRKDLLDAMRQGAPERYEGEVKRYYEELVK
jgi:hypothetical protein